MQKLLSLTMISMFCAVVSAQVSVSSGSVKRLEKFASRYVDARNVDVWLPDGYSPKKKYAVLYIHDGQMLFDAATTWNKQEWRVDETVGKLIRERKIKDLIVIGVWNNGDYRHSEYYPAKSLEYLSVATRDYIVKNNLKGKPRADDYLRFLVEELKPYIDQNFSTRKDRDHTFIAGASMGGLISLYALCEYPEVFGGAAAVSTHLPLVGDDKVPDLESVPVSFRTYLEKKLPPADSRKIYFDYGDQTLDAYYPPLQKKVDELMKAKGWTEKAWTTRFFAGENHSEIAWAKRLNVPLEFLLKK
jgi:enterochelin esterase-like enzyme